MFIPDFYLKALVPDWVDEFSEGGLSAFRIVVGNKTYHNSKKEFYL